jgi:hypothetical protein
MNPTRPAGDASKATAIPVPDVSEALKAASGMDEYALRAKKSVSNGSRTESFEEGAKTYAEDPTALHGDQPPSTALSHEKPIHVLMCYMMASGKSIKEIAEATQYSEGSVRGIAKQPWFRKRFLRVTSEAGKSEVESFLAGETMNSLEVLVQIRDENIQSRPHVSATAANSILDRALGKATQKVETENHNYDHGAAKSGSEIDRQIAQAEAELKALGQSPNSLN